MSIQELYFDKSLRAYALKLTKDKDLADEIFSQAFEKCINVTDLNSRYLATAIKNTFLSSKRSTIEKVEIYDIEDITDDTKQKVNDSLKKMHFYSRDLLECLMDGEKPYQIHKATGIHWLTLKKDIENAKQRFMNIYKDIKLGVILPGEPDNPETGEVSKNKGINAVKYHRLIMPLAHLCQTYNIDFKPLFNFKDDSWLLHTKDVTHVIFSREISSHFRQHDVMVIKSLQANGVKVICDVDDYWILPKHHVLYPYYKKTNLSQRYMDIITHSDVVWTTTKQLADKVKHLNKNVHIVKNALWDRQYINDDVELDYNSFNYFGGGTHKRDLSLIKGLMNDYEFNMMLTDTKPYINKWFPNANIIPPLFVNKYGNAYKKAGIFVIPLIENEFNSCKSELKMIEAGHYKKPCLVSNVAPYTNLATTKNSIKVINNPLDWQKAIKRIHNNRSLQEDLGAQLQEDVYRKHSMIDQNKIRLQTL